MQYKIGDLIQQILCVLALTLTTPPKFKPMIFHVPLEVTKVSMKRFFLNVFVFEIKM